MNILFLTLVFSESRGIYTDLMQERTMPVGV